MIFLKKITIASTLALLFFPFTIMDACPAKYDEEFVTDSKGNPIFRVQFHKNNPRVRFSDSEKAATKEAFSYWARVLPPAKTPATIVLEKTRLIKNDAHHIAIQKLQDVLSGTLTSHKIGDGLIHVGDKFAEAYLGPQSHLPPMQDKQNFYGLMVHELGHGLFNASRDNEKNVFDKGAKTFGGPNAHHLNTVLETHLPGSDLQKIPLDQGLLHIELNQSLMSPQKFSNYSIFMEAELALLQDVGWNKIDRRNFFGYSLYRNGQTVINNNGYFARNPEGTAYLMGTYNHEPTGVGLHIYGSRNHLTQKADILTEGSRAVGARVDGVGNTLIIDKSTKVHAHGLDGIGVLFAYGKDHSFTLHGEVKAEGDRGVGLAFDFGGNDMGSKTELRGSYWRSFKGKTKKPLSEHDGPLVKDVLIKGVLSGKKNAIYMSKSGFVKNITLTPDAQVTGDIISDYNQKNSKGKLYLTSLTFGNEDTKDNVEGQKFIYKDNIQGKNLDVYFTGPYTALYGGQHKIYRAKVAKGATLAGNSTFALANHNTFTNAGTVSPSSAESETFAPGTNIGTITIDGNYRQTDSGKLVIDISKEGKSDLLHVTKAAHLSGRLEVRPEEKFYPNHWGKKIVFLQADGGIKGDFSEKIMTPSPTLLWKFIKTDHSYGVASPFKKAVPKAQQLTVLEEQTSRESDQTVSNTENKESDTGPQLTSTEEEHTDTTEPKRATHQDQKKHPVSDKSPTVPTDNHEIAHVSGGNLEVMRHSNAYSQYATNVNEQSVGRVLDRVVDKTDRPDLYAALDFSAPDGSGVRSALAQLSPVAYGGAFGASVTREHQISDILNTRPYVSITPGSWQAFALPFISQTTSKARDLQVGISTHTTPGLIVGLEQQSDSRVGLTWGIYGVVGNKTSVTFKTADSARGSLQAWGFGLHARYQPDLLSGPYVSAQARAGLEQGSVSRTLSVGSYTGQQQGKWQGVTTTASALGGYLWKVHDHLSLGPLVGLDYTLVTHPRITEKGATGINMALDKARHHSLQSSLGIRSVVSVNKKLKIDLQAWWDRELFNTTLTQKARFANVSDSVFTTKTRLGPRDALNMSGQASYEVSPTVTIGAGASAQLIRSQKPNLVGSLSLNVKF